MTPPNCFILFCPHYLRSHKILHTYRSRYRSRTPVVDWGSEQRDWTDGWWWVIICSTVPYPVKYTTRLKQDQFWFSRLGIPDRTTSMHGECLCFTSVCLSTHWHDLLQGYEGSLLKVTNKNGKNTSVSAHVPPQLLSSWPSGCFH